jgi:hypothetical protein
MSAKSLNFAAELRDVLAKRHPSVSAVLFDSDGEPYMTIGSNAAAGQQYAVLKVKTILPLGVDSLGLAARGYATVVCQLVEETSTIANVPLLTQANQLLILGELGHRGARIELYMTANTVAATVGAIIAGNLKATFEPDLKYKTLSQQ